MDMEEIEKLEKQLIATKAIAKRMELKNKNGEDINISNCYIDINNIKGLDKYLEERDMLNDQIDLEKISDRYIIPVVLPDGEEIEVEVQNLANDIKPEMEIFDDGTSELLIRDEIEENISDNLKLAIDPKQYKETFLPEDIQKLAEKISQDELIPENDRDAARMLGIGNAEREEKQQSEEKELNKEDAIVKENEEKEDKENEENKEEPDINIDELPEEDREIISKIYKQDEELRKSGRLKQVLTVVNTKSITEKVAHTGIIENGGEVKLYRFRGDFFSDRVVTVQNERILTNTRNDRDLTNLMKDVRANEVGNLKDKESKISYEDLDGNKTTEDLIRKPTDLTMEKKREFEEKLNDIDKQAENIKNDESLVTEDKVDMYQDINEKRLDLFKEYGITLPSIEAEIEADMQTSEEIENDLEEEKEEINSESEIEEVNPQNEIEEDDERDPRENMNHFGGRTRGPNHW